MAGTLIKLTNAGRAALVGPGGMGTMNRDVVSVGIASAPFTHNDGLTALPNEVKRVTTMAGENIAPDTIHVTIRDDSADQYVVYGLGLYLDNGVLLGTYSQPTPIVEKSPVAIFLQAIDMQLATIDAALLHFGDTTFTNPPATDTRQGVVELATNAETQAGTDTARAVTPAGLASRTATETRTGIAEIATQAETDAGTDDARMVTPKKLAARTASETRTGIAELATQAETDAGTDDARIVTPKKLAARIAALVGNAPSNLDTLGELASSIGNDPDFLGTMSNALGLKAPLASPAFTGAPTAPTAPSGDSTAKLATTAFVQQELSNGLADAAPAMDGVAAVGTSTKTAREDHRHPTDTSRAPLASPAFTGAPTAPTATSGDNATKLATTAFVQAAANGMATRSVAGGANVTLTAAEAGYAVLKLTGALTANIDVFVPAAQSRWTVWNATTGAYTLRVKTAAGSGIYVTQGTAWQLLCDGTNVIDANSDFKDIALTGVPTAPTAAVGTNSTQVSTTAFVQAAIAALVNSSPGALDTLNELAAALGNDPNFATTMTNALALKAPLASPALTGSPTAPTAATGTSTAQLATTAFVQQEIAADLATAAPVMDGAAAVGTATKIAREDHRHPTDTTRAPLASPAFTGTPTAPTPAFGDVSARLVTTQFVEDNAFSQRAALGSAVDLNAITTSGIYHQPANAGASGGTNYPSGVAGKLVVYSSAGMTYQSFHEYQTANIWYRSKYNTTWYPWRKLAFTDGPAFTATPTAPTAAPGTNTDQLATTKFVQQEIAGDLAVVAPLMDGAAAVGVASRIAREDHRHPTDTTRAPLASPALTGTPTAPTAAPGTNTGQVSTTAFVQAAIAALVNSSPGALDTLNELAAALGNDPNFATTMTNALALKAPLASPALTGTPTAPTPGAGDSSTRVATTAYVQAQGYLPKVGGNMTGPVHFAPSAGAAGAIHTDGTGIFGGAFTQWTDAGQREYAVQIDAPSNGAAYGGLRWTQWGTRHFAAIDAYSGGTATSASTIDFHLSDATGAVTRAWSFSPDDITRGKGGYVYGSWNFNPASKVDRDGITFAGFAGADEWQPYFRSIATNNVVRMVRNTYAGGMGIGWDGGSPLFYTDGTLRGYLLTSANFTIWAATKGARVQWDSGVLEVGPLNSGNYDMPAPYVAIGVRTLSDGSIQAGLTYVRGVLLRNN